MIPSTVFIQTYDSEPLVIENNTYYVAKNEFYEKVEKDGETSYLPTTPPVDYELEERPADAETIELDGQKYYYSATQGAFYSRITRGRRHVYVVIDAPVGAAVSSLPKKAVEHGKGEDAVYQFDTTFFVKDRAEDGKAVYVVVVPPTATQVRLEALPEGTPELKAGSQTYYYIESGFYTRSADDPSMYDLNDPPIGTKVERIPDRSLLFSVGSQRYFQFDNVFFQDADGGYVVAEAPPE